MKNACNWQIQVHLHFAFFANLDGQQAASKEDKNSQGK
jgi:hypothetical protein